MCSNLTPTLINNPATLLNNPTPTLPYTFTQVAGKNGSKLTTPNAFLELTELTKEFFTREENEPKYNGGIQSLSEFSTWLSDFDPSVHRLEIPGQYAADIRRGDGPPRVEEHTCIVGVDPNILVMSSLRMPKRVKFLASKSL